MRHRRTSSALSAFVAHGFPEREFFAHNVEAIRKQYPDTFLLLAGRGVAERELSTGTFHQLNLYSEEVSGFPTELFTDRQVNWHNQQFGKKALIAACGIYQQGESLTITVLQSDLCQQLYRHPGLKRTCKTQIEKRFGHWHRLLFNAILDFAVSVGAALVRCPTGRSIVRATRKQVAPELFERIYDSPSKCYRCHLIKEGNAEYWEVRIAENQERIVRLTDPGSRDEPSSGPSICIFHDTEENVETDVSPADCRKALTAMLAIEKQHGVATTYDILGRLFHAKRDEVWASDPRHSFSFHSFNHDLEDETQLTQCRDVDLQVRGYRPPRSRLTSELTDYRLSYLNFEWLACSFTDSSIAVPVLQNGIVKIPIHTDDYPLITGQMRYEDWEAGILWAARNAPFFAFGLHDCYSDTWLPRYTRLLGKLASVGTLMTAEQISDSVFLGH